ncbi:HEAT repeat domain-containing protein [Gemmatimonadota bacterium]
MAVVEKHREKVRKEDERQRKFEARKHELIWKVEKLKEKRRIKKLIRLLNNPRQSPESHHLRRVSAAALGELGDIRASKHLVRFLREANNLKKDAEDCWYIMKVIRGLARIGDKRGTQPLVEVLISQATDDEVSSWIISALIDIGGSCPMEPILKHLPVWQKSLMTGKGGKKSSLNEKEWSGKAGTYTHPYYLAFDLLDTIEAPRNGKSWQEWWTQYGFAFNPDSWGADNT